MRTTIENLTKRLEKIADKKSIPFCYGCYKEARSGKCATCLSDDLMKLLPGVGCEYGDWIIEHLVSQNVQSINAEELFESSMDGVYPETTVIGFIEVDTLTAIKEFDPICWRMAVQEYESQMEDDGELMSFDGGSTYYLTNDIERYVEDCETELNLCEAEG